MKKAALTMVLVAVSAAVLPAGLSGQTANGSVSATATISANLVVTNVSDLNFGSMTPGAGATVSTGAPPAGVGQTLGALQVDHNSGVSVSATLPPSLVHTTAPGNVILVTFECGYSASASGVLVGGVQDCAALPDITHLGDGSPATTFLQVGGSINAGDTAGALPGTYTANVDFVFTSVF